LPSHDKSIIIDRGAQFAVGMMKKLYAMLVMNIEWDYNYYQPWSDNEWLVDEMLAMLDKDIIMQ